MNQTIEKWLTIGALVGWVASMGSLIGLALRAASPAVASRPAQATTLSLASRTPIEADIKTQQSPNPSMVQREVETGLIPADTSKGFWMESLKERSNRSSKWISERAR